MKIVSVVSSCRPNGNTEQLVKLLENSLAKMAEEQNASLQIEHISLSKADVQLCCGCRACFERGEQYCPRKDDILKIRDTILSANGVILASPVYVEDVNGLMKNWIDRMAFNSHRPAFYGKHAAIITTSGSGSSNHSLHTMKNALNSWGFTIESQGKFKMGAQMKSEQIQKLYNVRIKKAAVKLFKPINTNKAKIPSFYSLIVFQVQQRYYQRAFKKAALDYEYWKNNGWLDAHTNYYYRLNKADTIRAAFAGVLAYFISLFFK